MEAQRPYIQHRKKLTYDELQKLAHAEVQESEHTQHELADRLDVKRSTIGKAVTKPGPKFQRLQMRIIEELTDYELEMEKEVRFRARKKERAET